MVIATNLLFHVTVDDTSPLTVDDRNLLLHAVIIEINHRSGVVPSPLHREVTGINRRFHADKDQLHRKQLHLRQLL